VSDARWITEADVVALLGLGDAITAVETALGEEAAGRARTMEKTHLAWGDGHSVHAVGGQLDGLVGTKTWAHTPGGAAPLLVLWDAGDGRLVAVVEAFALGQLRTGAVSGVATRWLAEAHADELAILGSGKQAHAQVAAVDAVRSLRRIRVWSRTPEHAAAFAKELVEAGAPAVEVAASAAEAVAGAPIVTTATRARSPILESAMVEAGTHINAVGAITPERGEVHPDVVSRCDVVAADSPAAASRLARELAGVTTVPLSAIVAAGTGRPAGADLTLFRAMGIGLADVALGAELAARAGAAGAGRPVPQPVSVPLDLSLGGPHD
jgi:ornithine cyclodeaminase